MVPERFQQVATISCIKKRRPIREQNNRRRVGSYLGGVTDLGPPIVPHGRRLVLESPAQDAVEIGRAGAPAGLLVEVLREVQDRIHILARGRRGEGNGYKIEVRKDLPQVIGEFTGRPGTHQVPFVGDENRRLVLFEDVLGELFIHFADPLGRIEEEQHHVGATNRALARVRL